MFYLIIMYYLLMSDGKGTVTKLFSPERWKKKKSLLQNSNIVFGVKWWHMTCIKEICLRREDIKVEKTTIHSLSFLLWRPPWGSLPWCIWSPPSAPSRTGGRPQSRRPAPPLSESGHASSLARHESFRELNFKFLIGQMNIMTLILGNSYRA